MDRAHAAGRWLRPDGAAGLAAGVHPVFAKWFFYAFYPAHYLFIFLIDSLGLYLFTGILTFLMVPVVRLMEMLLNKKNKTICDFVTGIMVIEKLSYNGIH